MQLRRPLSDRHHHQLRRQRRSERPQLEPLEERLVLSLVAVSANDAKVNQTASVGQTLPSVAMDANGDYVVAWGDQTARYEYNVDARVYNKAGQAQTGEIVVGKTIGVPRPSVAMDANGDFVVTWQVLNSTSYLYGVDAQRYNLAGTAQGSTITLTSGSSRTTMGESPKVAMDSAGDFTIAYQGYDANLLGIFAKRYNSSGVAQGSTFGVNSVTTGSQSGPAIAMDSAGDFVIAWQDGGQAQNPGIYAKPTIRPAWPRAAIPRSARSRPEVCLLRPTPRLPWSRPASTSSPGNTPRRPRARAMDSRRSGPRRSTWSGMR